MKKSILFSLLVTVIFSTGCIKNVNNGSCVDKLVTSEAPTIEAYGTTNGFTLTKHPTTGLYYQVVAEGTGPVAFETSKIFVRYTGRLVSTGAKFDEQLDETKTGWFLNTLIPAWQIGIPLIKKGGTIRLVVPSSLAYGCRGYATIPGDAILAFDIQLVDIQ